MTFPTSPSFDYQTLIVTYICSGFALLLILIRLLWRHIRGERYLSFHDDLWMGISVLPLLARLALVHVILLYGTNAISEDLAAKLTPDEIRKRVVGSKTVLAGRIWYAAL